MALAEGPLLRFNLVQSKTTRMPAAGWRGITAGRDGPPADPSHRDTGRFAVAKFNVNGTMVEVAVPDDTPLLWAIREQIGLTGTKYGCGVAQCGACTVHIDGVATRSCSLPVSAVTPEMKIVTIEGLSPDGRHPLQQAWIKHEVPQCGFCQSGMLMAAAALLQSNPKPTEADIASEMTNICRCGTYNKVKAAILDVAGSGAMGRG